MKLQRNVQSTAPKFFGYDPRKGMNFVISRTDVASHVSPLLEDTDSKMFVYGEKSCVPVDEQWVRRLESPLDKTVTGLWESNFQNIRPFGTMWMQDLITFTIGKKVLAQSKNAKLSTLCGNKLNFEPLEMSPWIEGGNYWIVQDEGNQTLILGESMKDYHPEDKLKKILNVNKIIYLPQIDTHLDLFLRPLDKKRVLISDELIIADHLRNVIHQLSELAKKNDIRLSTCPEKTCGNPQVYLLRERAYKLETEIRNRVFKNDLFIKLNMTENILKDNGFEVIRVPGNIYSPRVTDFSGPSRLLNYMNSLCLYKKDNELLYITGKSNIVKYFGLEDLEKYTGFNFEKLFTEYLKPYIKETNIKFIDHGLSYLIKEKQGGLHCLCSEIITTAM